ncbi:MAG: hypothetical protein NVSMB65_01120 [Chloroflexota bacterium]
MREIRARLQLPPWAGSQADQKGIMGEDDVAARLHALDDSYTLLRNLTLPGSRGDIDGVLLTPQGDLWILEIKALTSSRTYRCHDLAWAYQSTPGGWRPLDTQPSRQAIFHAHQVKGTLRDAGLPSSPRAVVVLTTGAHVVTIAPRVPIVTTQDILSLVSHGAAPGRPREGVPGPETLASALLRAARAQQGPRT